MAANSQLHSPETSIDTEAIKSYIFEMRNVKERYTLGTTAPSRINLDKSSNVHVFSEYGQDLALLELVNESPETTHDMSVIEISSSDTSSILNESLKSDLERLDLTEDYQTCSETLPVKPELVTISPVQSVAYQQSSVTTSNVEHESTGSYNSCKEVLEESVASASSCSAPSTSGNRSSIDFNDTVSEMEAFLAGLNDEIRPAEINLNVFEPQRTNFIELEHQRTNFIELEPPKVVDTVIKPPRVLKPLSATKPTKLNDYSNVKSVIGQYIHSAKTPILKRNVRDKSPAISSPFLQPERINRTKNGSANASPSTFKAPPTIACSSGWNKENSDYDLPFRIYKPARNKIVSEPVETRINPTIKILLPSQVNVIRHVGDARQPSQAEIRALLENDPSEDLSENFNTSIWEVKRINF